MLDADELSTHPRGCRCVGHLEWKAAKQREYVARNQAKHKATPLTVDDPRHGRVATFAALRCRCEACTRANCLYQYNYWRRKYIKMFSPDPASVGVEAEG